MRTVLSVVLAICLAVSVLVVRQAEPVDAAFHCVRIHAVMGGYNGSSNIQYVELRLSSGGQTLIGGHVIQFFDSAGTLKATFTFPGGGTNLSAGDSLLVATSEFNAAVTGGTSDFTFTMGNTAGANGGDPLHPVQGMNGTVVFANGFGGCTGPIPVDSVAYGTAAATFGTAAAALPSPGSLQSLRLSNLNFTPMNNSTEYSLQSVSTSTFLVAPGNIATDFTTPRNNGRTVLKLPAAPAGPVGGVAEQPVLGSLPSVKTAGDIDRTMEYAIAGVLAAAAVTFGAGWYAYRRRVTQRA